jgi:hypothetical protein
MQRRRRASSSCMHCSCDHQYVIYIQVVCNASTAAGGNNKPGMHVMYLEEADLPVERVDGELQAVAAAGVGRCRRRFGPGRRRRRRSSHYYILRRLTAGGRYSREWPRAKLAAGSTSHSRWTACLALATGVRK